MRESRRRQGRKQRRSGERRGREKGRRGMSWGWTGKGQCKILSVVWNGVSACYELNQSTHFRVHSWLVVEKLPLIFFWFPFQGTVHGQSEEAVGGVGRLAFIYLFFCKYIFLFVQFFTIIIIKCKASFSCHSSSSHYSTQGFVLISFHLIVSKLKINLLYIFTCDLLFSFWRSELNEDRNVEK